VAPTPEDCDARERLRRAMACRLDEGQRARRADNGHPAGAPWRVLDPRRMGADVA